MEWRKNNREKYNKAAVEWGKNNPDRRHLHEIKRRYGITEQEYNDLLAKQGYKCALCDTKHDTSVKKGRLFVDHCHKSTDVRELLCSSCNSMLGYSKDNPELMAKAIEYLKKHSRES